MKKLLCVILSAALITLSLIIPAGASTNDYSVTSTDENTLPLIIVRGMLIDGLTVDAGTPDERNALGEIKAVDILKTIGKAGLKLVTKGKKAAVSEICSYAHTIFECFTNDKNGDSVYNVSVPLYPLSLDHYPDSSLAHGGGQEEGLAHAAMDTVGGDKTYFVNYDWRRSQLEVADDVNASVEQALADHPESDKVNIVSASMGGAVTMAYLTKYGYEKIHRCIFLSSTFFGTYVAGDCLTGRIVITPDTLCNFVSYHAPAAAKVMKALNKLGVLKIVCKIADLFIKNNKRQVYDELLIDTFGTMPGLWGVTLPERYEEAKEYLFGDKIDEYAGLIRRADALQKMAKGIPALLKQMEADGVEICVVASYNAPLAPVYEHAATNGDNTLETALMCGGAVVADLGKTLGDDYKADNPEKLSPDKVADLSNVIFPEKTWLVKDSPHVACRYGSDYSKFVLWLITSPEAPDVHLNKEYPQFMQSNANQDLKSMK